MVLVSRQYGHVRLIFQTTSLDSNYHTYEWQKELQMIVHDELQTVRNGQNIQFNINRQLNTHTAWTMTIHKLFK